PRTGLPPACFVFVSAFFLFFLFFFSSRRRHTRFSRDWSSDVCSSDLVVGAKDGGGRVVQAQQPAGGLDAAFQVKGAGNDQFLLDGESRLLERKRVARSEEHTSELQSRENLVCRLPPEIKNTTISCVL